MINYFKILPALFIIACSNINGYCSGQYQYNTNQPQEYNKEIDSYIAQLVQDIENIFNYEIVDRKKCDNCFMKYPRLEDKLKKIISETCQKRQKLVNDFYNTNDINVIGKLLEEYYDLIKAVFNYIEQYMLEQDKYNNNYAELEAYYEYVQRIMKNNLYPIFNQKLVEYERFNPAYDIRAIKFYYKEIEKFKELAKTLNDKEIKKIIQQKNKTFSRLYNGRFKKPTNQIINLLQDCKNKLQNINQDNYLDNITKVQNNIRKLNELNGEFNTLYNNKQKSINNNRIKRGINETFNYSIEDVYQLSQLIHNCCNYLQKEVNKIIKIDFIRLGC